MASSSAASNLLLGQPIAEKLTKSNHALWKAQVRAAVRGARLQGYLTGASQPPAAELVTKGADDKEIRVPNPTLEDWEATDQQVLSYLLNSLSKDILSQVATCATAAESMEDHRRHVRVTDPFQGCEHADRPVNHQERRYDSYGVLHKDESPRRWDGLSRKANRTR